MLKITILYGAVRDGRLSIRAAKAVSKAIGNTGRAEVLFIDLKDYELPVMTARLKDTREAPQQLQAISKAIIEADGIVFVSPEYNNSYSGAFKNMVDYFSMEWSHKPIGVVSASDGYEGGINASNLMQLLVLAINAFAMPHKLLFPHVQNSLDEEGNPLDERAERHLKKFARDMIWFTEAIANQKNLSDTQ